MMNNKLLITIALFLPLNYLHADEIDNLAIDYAINHDQEDVNNLPQDQDSPLTLMRQLNTLQQELAELRGQMELQHKHLKDLRSELDENQQAKKSASTFSLFSNSSSKLKNKAKSKASLASSNDSNYMYQSAYKLVVNHMYDDAIVAFQDYLEKFPTGENRTEAQFWLAEIFLSKWHENQAEAVYLDNACNSFKQVATAENHPKASQALLKLGLIANEHGRYQEAREYYDKVKSQYPNSASGRIAVAKLQKLNLNNN